MSREGLPSAVLEAMSCGLPVIIGQADWGGDCNVFSGIILERDPDLLYQGTLKLYYNPDYRVKLMEMSRQAALEIIPCRCRQVNIRSYMVELKFAAS